MPGVGAPSDHEPSAPAWVQLLSKYGLGTLIALFLVWKLAESFDAKLAAFQLSLDAHQQSTVATDRSREQNDALRLLLLKAICENTAKTDAERMVCREAGR